MYDDPRNPYSYLLPDLPSFPPYQSPERGKVHLTDSRGLSGTRVSIGAEVRLPSLPEPCKGEGKGGDVNVKGTGEEP